MEGNILLTSQNISHLEKNRGWDTTRLSAKVVNIRNKYK